MENEAPSLDEFEYTLTRRALRQIKAEAWDEGRTAVLDVQYISLPGKCGVDHAHPKNPYREAAS